MIVQGLWVGNKISKIEYMSYSSFIDKGFEYWLYTYENIPNLPKKVIQKPANEILEEKYIQRDSNGSLGGFSDLFRWSLLAKNGGIYVDSDIICVKPFNIEGNAVAGEYNPDSKTVKESTQFLKFQKGNEVVEKARAYSLSKDLKKIKWAEIGPKLIQKLASGQDGVKILPYENFNCNHYWNWEFVLSEKKTEYILDICKKDNVYGIHLWNEMWRRKGIDKESEFKKNSFMDILEKKYLKS